MIFVHIIFFVIAIWLGTILGLILAYGILRIIPLEADFPRRDIDECTM